MTIMKAPFPWFGGKSRVAGIVWERFGDVPNYVEPFAGSLAVLLVRPTPPRLETVNDLDCYLANFWRAVKLSPDDVAKWADWPVNEADLHARHAWLVERKADFAERVMGDPEFHDAKVAGWWVWGLCCWIGGGWCSAKGPWRSVDGRLQAVGGGVARQRPHLGTGGMGTHSLGVDIRETMRNLRERLRRVRVCCGSWERGLDSICTDRLGTTGIFLDPPYADTADRDADIYSTDSLTVAHEVREWCIANGDNPMLRIALCGYEGEHVMPESWECVPWKAAGGYDRGRNGSGLENSAKERIWFSPACLKPQDRQRTLFDLTATG